MSPHLGQGREAGVRGRLSDLIGSCRSLALFCFVLQEKILSWYDIEQYDKFHVPSTVLPTQGQS